MPPARFSPRPCDRIASRTRPIIERRDHPQFRRSLQTACHGLLLRDKEDENTYCLTGECSRDVKRCLTKRAPVASLILWLRRSSFSDF